ncbi:DUF4434 domain-containing protein [Comamonas testosteroni]|uniref:DUF4434 domain-containing protein n=1 Tax=Comamonas testosteroni TaxID=285 RepID=UPI0026EBFC1C|nr:DUF4434 domain-containing protein [Comamonas testosteroni]
MLRYVDMGGYTLVTIGQEDIGSTTKLMENGMKANREYLRQMGKPPKGGRLTGSFIYSHPPDYVGRNTMEWNTSDWRTLFQEMKEIGIDTVIYQAAAWAEVRECNYPSSLFEGFRMWNSLDYLVEAVAKEGMRFFLGGLGNLYGFDEKATIETLSYDRDQQLACYDELVALYNGGFHGFYMSPETAYPGARQPKREKILNTYFREVCQGVKDRTPSMPILFSPGTYFHENKEQEVHDFLYNLFAGCPLDIMCPQDSIGTFGNRLPHLQPSFAIWKQICDELSIKLWVNVESFEREKAGTTLDFGPAAFERLAVQLSHASQVGEKIVSWEVPYFYSSQAGERGLTLRRAYLESLRAGERD